MGSTGVTVLFLWVALSMVALGSAAPDHKSYNSSYISLAALECSDHIDPAKSARKLVGLRPPEPPAGCPVRFDLMTKFGTIGTYCKGTRVTATKCCAAFKAFACPYRNLMNDVNNGCASEMFFMIISTYRLPLGMFSLMCHDVAQGLDCEKI